MTVVLRVALVLFVPSVAGSAWIARPTSPAPERVRPVPRAAPAARQRTGAGEEGAVDLYGNSVNEAVATYQVDAAGSLYELHSPQTEVPQLKPPKS